MTKTKILTGITPSGMPHFGNYAGAIQPCLTRSKDPDSDSYFFLADYHALIKTRDPLRVHQASLHIAATWLALGLDTERVTFYRQSDVPQIPELCWILTCLAAKGLMNRAHAYKAATAENKENGLVDADAGITMGLFNYPILMAADIVLFNAHKVPVGKDQIQHIEMARDIAARFNHHYGERFILPEALIEANVATISGLDGRKMSKSYNNTIPLFCPEKQLLKLIRKIKTNSLAPGEPKETEGCTLFQLFYAVSSEAELNQTRQDYAQGAGWGQLKNDLFERINAHLSAPRQRYYELLDNPSYIETQLQKGAEKARTEAEVMMQKVRKSVGIFSLA